MAKYRRDRVQESIKVAISEAISSMKDPRLGFATLTDVELSNDMSHAKVFVSILGNQSDKKSTMDALNSAKGFIRTTVGQKVHLRIVPDLNFLYDDSIERGANILKLISELNADEK